jgi:hypothetical protein
MSQNPLVELAVAIRPGLVFGRRARLELTAAQGDILLQPFRDVVPIESAFVTYAVRETDYEVGEPAVLKVGLSK